MTAGPDSPFVRAASGGYEIHLEAGTVRDLKGSVTAPSAVVTLEEMEQAIATGALRVMVS